MKMPVFKLNLPPKVRNYPFCGQKKVVNRANEGITEQMRVLPSTLAGLAMKGGGGSSAIKLWGQTKFKKQKEDEIEYSC